MNDTKITTAIATSFATLLLAGTVWAVSIPRGIPTDPMRQSSQGSDKRPIVGPDSIIFGAYDPHSDFSDDPNSKIEHLFLPWEDVDLSSLAVADQYALKRGRTLLITVEPWSWSVDWRGTSDELIKGILAGNYDRNMSAVCSAAANLKSAVTIRWAQEMDESDNRFTWAHWKPSEYVAAYQRMVAICREHNKSAKYMWSPKGNIPGTTSLISSVFRYSVSNNTIGTSLAEKGRFLRPLRRDTGKSSLSESLSLWPNLVMRAILLTSVTGPKIPQRDIRNFPS
jgi:beta-mannanase